MLFRDPSAFLKFFLDPLFCFLSFQFMFPVLLKIILLKNHPIFVVANVKNRSQNKWQDRIWIFVLFQSCSSDHIVCVHCLNWRARTLVVRSVCYRQEIKSKKAEEWLLHRAKNCSRFLRLLSKRLFGFCKCSACAVVWFACLLTSKSCSMWDREECAFVSTAG